MFEARGEIYTVPAEKGNVRNLTRTPAMAERDPSWSPDGKSVAFFRMNRESMRCMWWIKPGWER